jgi:hypothetical protein
MTWVRSTLGALALGGIFATGACMSTEAADTSPGNPCGVMADPAVESAGSTNLVLIDRSGSTQAKSRTDYVPVWSAGLESILPVESDAEYRVAPFAGGRYVSWPAESLRVPVLTGTRAQRAPLVSDITKCLKTTVDKVALPPGSKTGTDILAAMNSAGAELSASRTKGKHLYVASDGRASTGCAKPSSGHHLTEDGIGQVVTACRESGELPLNLQGVSITFVGLGTSSSSVSAVLPREARLLTGLWLAICREMKAVCKAHDTTVTQRVSPATAH